MPGRSLPADADRTQRSDAGQLLLPRSGERAHGCAQALPEGKAQGAATGQGPVHPQRAPEASPAPRSAGPEGGGGTMRHAETQPQPPFSPSKETTEMHKRSTIVSAVAGAALLLLFLLPISQAAAAPSPWWQLLTGSRPTNMAGGESGRLVVSLTNLGDAPVDGSKVPV